MSLLEDTQPTRPEPEEPTRGGPSTCLKAGLVCGVHTDLVVTRYKDKLFVAVTQLGKLGNITEVRREQVQGAAGEQGGRVVYSCQVLLGQDTEEIHLLARILAEKIELDKPLVLCVGIKGLTVELAKQLVDFILKNID